MPQYRFRAVSQSGEQSSGVLEASESGVVVQTLHKQGLIPLEVSEATQNRGLFDKFGDLTKRRTVNDSDLLAFTQQLGTLLQAGIPLDRALSMMQRQSTDYQAQVRVESVLDAIRKGSSFSKALRNRPDLFSDFYVSLVQAAEVSGDLGQGLLELSVYLERSKQVRDQVVSALIYPTILIFVSGASLLIILTLVVPQFEQLFADMGRELPWSTAIVLSVASGIQEYGILLGILFLVILIAVRLILRQPEYRQHWDQLRLQIPYFGVLDREIQTGRFCRSLGTLLSSGVPLYEGLSIAKETLTNLFLKHGIEAAMVQIKEGKHLAGPLETSELFPSLATQMIQVGEETGSLDQMLMKIAKVYDQEVSTSIQRLLGVLSPALILGLGAMIAGIIISILTAIMSINDIPL